MGCESNFLGHKLTLLATSLKCGGIVITSTFDHRIADAYSANMFLMSWAEMAQPTKPTATTTTPCFRRSLLSPRRPSSIPYSLYDMYVPISKITPPQATTTPLLSRIYYVTAEQLEKLQSIVVMKNENNTKRTKFECFSAFLWKIVAQAASRGNNKGKQVIAKMGIVVDGRKRLCDGDKGKEALMGCYFGNVLSIHTLWRESSGGVDEKPLGFVAEAVHEFLEVATKEWFLGLIDWVEAHRPEPGVARIYCGGGGGDEGPSFVVSSGQRLMEGKMDFGRGEVVFGPFHFPWGGEAGYVMPMLSPLGNGDWVVYMHLAKEQLEVIESEASDVFRPISWDYLNQ